MNDTGHVGCGIGPGLQFPTIAKAIEKTSIVLSLQVAGFATRSMILLTFAATLGHFVDFFNKIRQKRTSCSTSVAREPAI
jgi:hypothetical protein